LWANRGEATVLAGLGTAACVEGDPGQSPQSLLSRCRERLAGHPELKFYGGFAFRGDRPVLGAEWQPFGSAFFWLPRLTFDGHCLRLVVLDRPDVRAALRSIRQLRPLDPGPPEACPACLDRVDLPDQASWFANVEKTLGLFRDEVLEKVVLARRATFRFDGPLCPLTLTERLSTGPPVCYRFCFQIDPQTAFLGATPERLFLRHGDQLESEAVAGTRRRGQDPTEDQSLADDMSHSAKDQLEHDIVRKGIRQRLHSCVQSLKVDAQASVLKLPRKQHLYSHVRASLRPPITDGELMERLHPTPAVGGYPTDNALAEIEQLEPFERGWYAAPVGWIDAEAAEFAVAIRSGLVQGNQLCLYSGAGIVPGSTAEAEWDEIEHKIGDFLDIIRNSTFDDA
jgi:menaquinone-specific isochorismate synthase